MVTPLENSPNGFNYVLTTPDYKTAANLAAVLNGRFGARTATATDAETVHVSLPPAYAGNPVQFLADAGDLTFQQDETGQGRDERAHRYDRLRWRHQACAVRDRPR